jgi:hypothetical protein
VGEELIDIERIPPGAEYAVLVAGDHLAVLLAKEAILRGVDVELDPVPLGVGEVTTTTDGRPYVAPTATGAGTGKKVGFDNTHGSTAGAADWTIDGAMSDFACGLAGQGYAVATSPAARGSS